MRDNVLFSVLTCTSRGLVLLGYLSKEAYQMLKEVSALKMKWRGQRADLE
jgi:hypothetical protein